MKKAILMIIPLFILCGCGYREIERGFLVTAVGFAEQDGITEIVAEAVSSSSFTDKTTEKVILSGSGADVASALKNLKSQLTKPLYFEQLGTVVLDTAFNTETKNEILNLLHVTDGLHTGIYIVKSDDVTALFDINSPDGILGYDIIGLVKNYEQQTDIRVTNQLYYLLRGDGNLPLVNAVDGSVTIDVSEE